MSHEFANNETQAMFSRIKETRPETLINDAHEAQMGYVGLTGLAAEIKSIYSQRFTKEFSETELANIDWQQIVAMLATLKTKDN